MWGRKYRWQQCGSTQFSFQLSTDSQRCLFAEEIVVVDDFSVLVLLQVVQVLCRHLEHVAGNLAVACCDEWRVEIEKSVLMEIRMDSHCHVVADAHDDAEGVGAQTHVCMLTHVLERLSLLLHRVVAATESIYLYRFALHF